MTTKKDIALQVEHLTASYGRDPAVADLSFEAAAGDLMAIVGPNGAGKSTLIKAIVGAHPPDAGSVRVFGADGKDARQKITYVPQRGDIDWDFPVTVRDVVNQGRWGHTGLLGRLTGRDTDKVAESLEMVGVTDLADRQIGELSGGQQQRVFLARALAQEGDVYLLDEPFVGVDAATERAIADVLRRLVSEGRAVLVVHHDLSTIREYFDQILLMNKKAIACGTVDAVFTAENLEATYGGTMTVMDQADGTVLGGGG